MKNLLIGLLGGISLGMLFAPEKGSEFRKKLANSDQKIKLFGETLLSAGKDASDEVKTFIDTPEVQDMITKGKTSAEDLLAKGKNLSEKGKEEAKSLIAKANEAKDKVLNKKGDA